MSLPPTATPGPYETGVDPQANPADLFLAFFRHPAVVAFIDRACLRLALSIVGLNLAGYAWSVLS